MPTDHRRKPRRSRKGRWSISTMRISSASRTPHRPGRDEPSTTSRQHPAACTPLAVPCGRLLAPACSPAAHCAKGCKGYGELLDGPTIQFSEENRLANENTQDATSPSLNILAQYIKDLSFENPGAPRSLQARAQAPAIHINIGSAQCRARK